jgi:hypothetical protein
VLPLNGPFHQMCGNEGASSHDLVRYATPS